ncbi:MAG: sporulation transcriptional regulator SpoIIID, partial [Firmicutes bacterium]|nr:sporulation transcriptional regulator SpoIIID [Bacillota bacterium]
SGATVRQTATKYGISKSTVHKDVTERLPQLNEVTASRVRSILDKNKAQRHLRGGEATRQKYLHLREADRP